MSNPVNRFTFIPNRPCRERYQAANHYQNNVVGICVSCQYTIPTSLASSPRKLRHAIDLAVSRVILQHPMLRVGMIGEGSRKPAWIQLAEIDLSQLIHWHTIDKDTDYLLFSQHILETQLDTKFSNIETCPPWRLVVLQQEASNFIEIMFIFHHSVSDGVGGKLFHASLFRNLNSSAADEQLPSLTNGVLELTHAAKQLEHFPPSQTDMCKYPVSLGYALEKLWKVRAPPCAISDKEFRAAWAPILLSPRKTRTHRISLRDSEVQSLLRVCRKNNTTLTGLIHGIMLVTLAFTLHEEEASAFTAGTAMDMRPFTPPSPSKYPWLQPRETLANIVSGVRHEFSPILVARARSSIKASLTQSDPKPALAEALWSIAAVSRRQIEEAIKLGVRNNVAGLMSTVSDWHAYVAAQAKKPRVCSWNITNLGVFEPESPDRGRVAPSKSWGVKQASFTVCSQHIDNAILLSLIKAKDGDLVIDVVRQDGIFEDGLASDVSNALEDWLSYFASVGSEKVEAS